MSQEVKIKLTADGSQVKKEIKLIDQELRNVGGAGRGKSSSSSHSKAESSTSRDRESSPLAVRESSSEKVKQEARDKVDRLTLRELIILRKELQKQNGTGGYNRTNSGGGGIGTPPTNSGSRPALPPPPNSGNGGASGTGGGRNVPNLVSSLLTAATALRAVTSIYSSLKNSAQTAQTGASLAYTTFGSTLAYTDYNQARKDASNLGAPWGFDSSLVMNASEINMSSGAGFTTKENYESDMNAILKTSKLYGIDAGSLSGASGYMSSLGITESGNQKKFADLLAESIVQAQMTGREKEQLQVLEQIADNLGSRNTTVTDEQLTNSLGIYNALIAQNENLKGTRGGNLTTTMQDLASSGNSSLDVLAGFGTTYTGLKGQLELRKLAEENPQQYWSQVYEGVQKFGLGEDYFKKLLYDNTGSISQAEDIMSSLSDISMKTYNINDTSSGEAKTESLEENYTSDKISTEERHEVEKQEKSDDRGNAMNNFTKPFQDFYNNLSDWGQQAVDIAHGAGKIGGMLFGAKALGQGFTNWRGTGNPFSSGAGGGFWKNFWNKGASSASSTVDDVAGSVVDDSVDNVIDLTQGSDGVWGYADDGAESIVRNTSDDIVSNSVDDVVSNSVDDIVSNVSDDIVSGVSNAFDDIGTSLVEAGKGASQAIDEAGTALATVSDDIVSNTSDDLLGGVLKGVLGKSLGIAVQAGIGGYKYATADNKYEKSEAVGETGGGMLGGLLGGVFGGAIGSIAVGWAGGELGKTVGKDYQEGVDNYGTGLAGDWNPLNGLFRKDGTLSKQKLKEEQSKLKSRATVGNPSDYGLDSKLNDYVTWYEENGTVYGDISSFQMKKIYGKDWESNKKVQDAHKKWLEAQGRVQKVTDKPSDSAISDYESFQTALQNSVNSDGSYDLSFMKGMNKGQAEEWLGKAFPQMKEQHAFDGLYEGGKTAWDYKTEEGNIKNWESFMDSIGISGEVTSANTDAVKGLTTEISGMRKSLEDNGISGTSAWTDETVKAKYQSTQGINNPFSVNSKTSGSLFPKLGGIFSQLSFGLPTMNSSPLLGGWFSHATGNDYVPYDNYTALLHKGEMVLTSSEANDYRQGKVGSGSDTNNVNININLTGNVSGMTAENQTRVVNAVVSQINSSEFQKTISDGFIRVQNH